MPRNRRATPLTDRFWPKVNFDGPEPSHQPWLGKCWLWTASTNNGYGQIGRGRRGGGVMGAHVASWIIAKRPLPDGMCVLHKCDVKLCVRPDHLFVGTAADNNRDMHEKGRAGWQVAPEVFSHANRHPRPRGYNRGETNAQAKLTDAAVAEIRNRYATGETNKAALGREYAVSDSLIRVIVQGRAWKHI